MKDEYVLLAAVAVAVYGFYKASTKRVAGYNATPPPTLPDAAPRLVPRMPGVSPTLLEILTEIVDTPGGVLAGPLSPAGYEPDDLKQLVDDIIERVETRSARELSCVHIDGGTCYATSDGDKQYDFTCHLHDRQTATTLKVRVTMLKMNRGDLLLTTLKPHDTPPSAKDPVYKPPPKYSTYTFPVQGI